MPMEVKRSRRVRVYLRRTSNGRSHTYVGVIVLNGLVDVAPLEQLNVSFLLPQLYSFFLSPATQLFRVDAFVLVSHSVRVGHGADAATIDCSHGAAVCVCVSITGETKEKQKRA